MLGFQPGSPAPAYVVLEVELKQGEHSADSYSPSPVMLDILKAACWSYTSSEAPLWVPGVQK